MIERIVSGGQTGADRAALDWAISRGIPHSGWCPKGRKAEDCQLDARYNLKETPSASYLQRTEWNARDSDGTVIFSLASVLTGGSLKTQEFAAKHKKPCAHIHAGMPQPESALRRFVEAHGIKSLNVAGPRGSKEPGVYAFVFRVLDKACSFPSDAALPRTGSLAENDNPNKDEVFSGKR